MCHAALKMPPRKRRLPIDGVRLGRRLIIWFPDLDSLVRLAANETQAGLVKGGAKDAIFGIERTGLSDGVHGLVAVACLPVLCRRRLLAEFGDGQKGGGGG